MIDIRCPHCEFTKEVPLKKIPPGTRWVRCPRCGNRFEYEKRGETVATEGRHPVPWERRLELGLWRGIRHTMTSVLFSPQAMFSAMPVRGGWSEPLAFGLLVGSISSMAASFWEFVLALSGIVEPWWSDFISLNLPILFLFLIVLSPLFVALDLLVSTVIIHFLLFLVRGGKGGLEATGRVVAYSQAAMIWSMVPVLGGLVGWLWKTTVQIIGLKEAHKISYGKIIVAFLIPVGVVIVLAVTGALLFITRL
jgi:predicted Zn finger-like uncharacterized protein